MSTHTFNLSSVDETALLARLLGSSLGAGDVLLLNGPIGAGKTHFCRSLIQNRLSEISALEDVPSPTFTIVQTYELEREDIWHADLYRLTSPDELYELGIEDAFEQAIVLIEWPDRLGKNIPKNALTLTFEITGLEQRNLHLEWVDLKWDSAVKTLAEQFAIRCQTETIN